MAFKGLLLRAAYSLYFQSSPRPRSQHSSLHLQPSSRPGGQSQRASLSCSGCCAPALTASAPLAVPDSKVGSASWLKAGNTHPYVPLVPLECRVWLNGQRSTGLLVSEPFRVCSAAGRSSGPSGLWKESICLIHIWEVGPREAREDPGDWGPRLRREPR